MKRKMTHFNRGSSIFIAGGKNYKSKLVLFS